MDAAHYLRSRSLKDRRANGAVYTPPHLVEFVLDLAGYLDEKPLETVRVLDPACGAGAFLVVAMRSLARSIEKRGLDLRSTQGARVLAELATQNLVGIDIDPRACALARSALGDAFRALTCSRVRPPEMRIESADFLQMRTSRSTPLGNEPMGLVVGNPPYVTTTRLGAARKEKYRQRFETAHGRIDLYQLFFERALEVLAPGGRVAFITSDKFLTSHSGARLRGLLAGSGAVLTVARFKSHRVFANAATVPCVTVVEKNGDAADLASLECDEQPDKAGRIVVLQSRSIPQRALSRGPWELGQSDLLQLCQRLISSHPHLEQRASRISAGLATGRDSLFVMSASNGPDIEEELLRPVLRGRDIDAFSVTFPGLLALVPYHFKVGTSPRLVDLARYPRARRYLSRQRAELEARHCVRVWRKKWYDLHDPVPFDVSKALKIVVPDIAEHNRFAVDEGRHLPLHSAYYIVPAAPRETGFLASLLNSTALTFLMRFRSPVVKDGFSRYRRQFLKELPIPQVDRDQARAITRAGQERDLDLLDELVYRALRIDKTEAGAMREFLASAAQPLRR